MALILHHIKTLSLICLLFYRLYKYDLMQSEFKKNRLPRQTKVIADTLSWIDGHFSEQITLEKLSEISGMNEKYLCRIFKEYTSKTPMNYVNEYRIDNACIQIAKGGRSLTQIAYDCGFNDSGYFTKTFKKYKGITPAEYRKTFRKK